VLWERLRDLGVDAFPSQGNFLFARFQNALWVRDALAGLGIAVRAFPDKPLLDDGLRITLPGRPEPFERLLGGLACAVAPRPCSST